MLSTSGSFAPRLWPVTGGYAPGRTPLGAPLPEPHYRFALSARHEPPLLWRNLRLYKEAKNDESDFHATCHRTSARHGAAVPCLFNHSAVIQVTDRVGSLQCNVLCRLSDACEWREHEKKHGSDHAPFYVRAIAPQPEPCNPNLWLKQQYVVLKPANSYTGGGAFWRVRVVDLVVLACVFRAMTKKSSTFLHALLPHIFL